MISQISRNQCLFTVLLVAILTGLQSLGSANPVAHVRLGGYIPLAKIRSAHLIEQNDPSEAIPITFVMRLRNETGLNNFLRRVSDPKDQEYGHYLTSQEFTERYGPSESDYSDVKQFATASGLTITRTCDDRLLLDATGSARKVEAAFGTHILHYQEADGHIFRAPSTNPCVPSDLQSKILCVIGLDTATVRRSFSQSIPVDQQVQLGFSLPLPNTTGSGVGGGLKPNDITRAYNLEGLSLPGYGQTLGLFELDGYRQSDINQYEAKYALPNVPIYPFPVSPFNGSPGKNTGEVALDIELQVALTPNIYQIYVYEGENNDNGILDTFHQIAQDNIAKVISVSWGAPEADTSERVKTGENEIFQKMEAQGQTVCAASGDHGAGSGYLSLNVNDPASQPLVLSVGGTTLFTNGPGGSFNHESAWNDGVHTTYPQGQKSVDFWAGGGGVSKDWPQPDYQTGSGAAAGGRNVPDVSLNSDLDNGYSDYFNGSWYLTGGTSAAAPLWASFLSIVNQERHWSGLPVIGFANPAIYQIAESGKNYLDFHDIREGNNGYYPAVAGYDDATGWGSFIGSNLVADLSQPPASSGGANDAAYVSDVTVPDKTVFRQNQAFTKVWQIKNTGSSTWGAGYKWTFDGGDRMGGPDYINVPSTGGGATWNPSVNLQAPSNPGTYRGYWRMEAPNGQKFGDRVWVLIQVSHGGANVTTYVSESDAAAGPDQPGFWKQGTASYWHDATGVGDGGHMYWTYNNDNAHGTDDVGFWRPNLPTTQPYEVFVFIPRNYATTKQAHYSIYAADGQHDVTINQEAYYDQWVSLGTYQFNSGTGGYLRLIDQTGEAYTSTWVGFDSAQWQPRSSILPPPPTQAIVSESDTAPYDGAAGFFRHGTPQYWHDAAFGDGGHMYWTYNNDAVHGSDDVGDWRPSLGTPGNYEVSVFIPNNYADTTQAHYTVYAADGPHDAYVNQSVYFNQWVSLGTYRFSSGTGGFLRLIDQTNEKYISKWVGFDTARWNPRIGNANAPGNLQPSGDAVVSPSVSFSWQDNGMSDGNRSVNFQVQVWHVVGGQRADQVWSSDWQSGTSRAWSAPGPGEYEWVVQAGNGQGQSTASSPARFVVPVPAPDAPSGLTAEVDSPTAVDLAWLDNSSNETGSRSNGGAGAARTPRSAQ